MIKFIVREKGRVMIGLGLSAYNMDLLKQGRPIKIDIAELGVGTGDIVLFYGDTEESMMADLQAAGFELPAQHEWHSDSDHEHR